MYIPKHYQGADKQNTLAFMQRFNFGTIVTSIDNVPQATHLPFVVNERDGEILITSHFAKANKHWEQIALNENLIIFSEPHAYVSPEHYNKKENVPTWNYLSVHAYGKAKIIDNQQDVFQVLETMMESFEPKYRLQWEKLDSTYKTNMANGIVAFEVIVSRLESKEKLSQNKKENEQKSIIDTLSKSGAENEKLIAEYMKRNELK